MFSSSSLYWKVKILDSYSCIQFKLMFLFFLDFFCFLQVSKFFISIVKMIPNNTCTTVLINLSGKYNETIKDSLYSTRMIQLLLSSISEEKSLLKYIKSKIVAFFFFVVVVRINQYWSKIMKVLAKYSKDSSLSSFL